VSKAYIIATEAIKDPSGMAGYAKAAEAAIATWRVLRSPAKALGPQRGAPHSEPVRLVRGWPIVIIALTSSHTAQRYCALLGTTSYLLSLAVACDAGKVIFGGLVDPDLMNQPARARGGRRARRHLAAPGCLLPHAPAGSVGQRRRVALSASPAAQKKEGVRT